MSAQGCLLLVCAATAQAAASNYVIVECKDSGDCSDKQYDVTGKQRGCLPVNGKFVETIDECLKNGRLHAHVYAHVCTWFLFAHVYTHFDGRICRRWGATMHGNQG